jgi:DNA polymerase III delta prime subunit
MNNLFVEKYRPSELNDYVGNPEIKQRCETFINEDEIPHLLLHGKAGTGKTTLAKILTNNISCDHIYINASDENNVETVRNKIKGFASTVGFNKWKIIVLDEADYLTPNAQAILRNLMETFSNTTRFILTCNYVEKIIEPIRSRCQTFKIQPPSMKDIALRLSTVLTTENIGFNPKDVKFIIENDYPDIRKMLGTIQSNVVDGNLKLSNDLVSSNDTENKIIDILQSDGSKKDKFVSIRQLLLDSGTNDYTNLYSLLYRRIDDYGVGNIAPIILEIADGENKSAFAVDKEITAMATLIKILDIIG